MSASRFLVIGGSQGIGALDLARMKDLFADEVPQVRRYRQRRVDVGHEGHGVVHALWRQQMGRARHHAMLAGGVPAARHSGR